MNQNLQRSLFALTILAISAQATTRIVPSLYFPTIAAAMNASSPGDTIYLLDVINIDPEQPLKQPQVNCVKGVTIAPHPDNENPVTIFPLEDEPLFVADGCDVAIVLSGFAIDVEGVDLTASRAIYSTESTFVLEDMTISHSFADGAGGSVYAENSSFNLTGCTIEFSQATAEGGAVYAYNSDFALTGCTIQYCTSVEEGGAIYAYSTKLVLDNCTLENCRASDGGGLYFHGYDSGVIPTFPLGLEILGETAFLYSTTSGGDGGGAWLGHFASAVTNSCTNTSFIDCGASLSSGGGLYIGERGLTFSDIELESNDAMEGGGLYSVDAIGIVDCHFTSNEGYTAGGAIWMAGGTIANSSFTENTTSGVNSEAGAVYNFNGNIAIADCEFIRNVTYGNETGNGGAVSVYSGELIAERTLFAGNRAVSWTSGTTKGGVLYSDDKSEFYYCTFANNEVYGATVSGSVIYSSDNVELYNCNLAGNLLTGSPTTESCTVYMSPEDLTSNYTNSYGNEGGNWVCGLAGHDTDLGNLSVPPNFVNPVNPENDFRLKWNSPLLDAGNSLNGELDFDLTQPDIGWQKAYPVLTNMGFFNSTLPAGRYEISSNTTRSATGLTLEDDVVIRVAAGVKLSLDDPSNGGSITIGDINGARTAIVGATELPNEPSDLAGSIIFGHAGVAQPCDLEFAGTLFNVGPRDLWFNSSNVSLIGPMDSEGQNCEFRQYGGSVITFANSTGSFSGFDFAIDAETPLSALRGIYLQYSDMDIKNINFATGNQMSDPLASSAYGIVAFGAPSFTSGDYAYSQIRDCDFLGSVTYPRGNYVPCRFFYSQAGLRENHFMDTRYHALSMWESTLHMEGLQHGQNVLKLLDGPEYMNPLIDMKGSTSLLHLACGHNAFVNPQVQDPQSQGFIDSDRTQRPSVTDWARNFWGTSYEGPGFTTLDLCDLPTGCDLPSWAEPYPTLTSSVGPWPPCFDELLPGELYAASLLAQENHDYMSAWELWKEIVLNTPQAEEAGLSANRMKSVALNTTWGEENSPTLVADLLQAADSAWAVSAPLAVVEATHAWVVEAFNGDRELALAQLDSLMTHWTAPADQKVITLGLAEVATFPTAGGLSSTGGAAMATIARVANQVEFRQFLLDGGAVPAADRSETVSTRPEGFLLSPAMPNPFNPTTRLELSVTLPGNYQANLYNLQGQLVRSLLRETLPAGVRHLTVDGADLASGVYIVRAAGPQGQQHRKLLLVK